MLTRHFQCCIYIVAALVGCITLSSCQSLGFKQKKRPGTATSASAESAQTSSQESSQASETAASSGNAGDFGKNSSVTLDSLLAAASTSTANPGTSTGETSESPDCLQAAMSLQQAVENMDRGNWSDAVTSAISAGVCPDLSQNAYDIAFGAATMLDSASVQMAFMFASDPLSRAVYGLEFLRSCIATHNIDCITTHREAVLEALRESGLNRDAHILQAQLDGIQSGTPVAAVLLPLSGQDRRMGRAMLGAFLHAAGLYAHQGIPWDLRFFDTASNPDNVEKLLKEASGIGAKLILGPLDIQEAQAAANAIRNNGQIMLSFAPNDSFINDNAFQLSYSLDEETAAVVRLALSEGLAKVISVFPEGRFGDTVASMFEKKAASSTAGRITTSRVVYPADQVDLRNIASIVAKQAPDAIFLPTDAASAERFLSFLAQENTWCRTTANVLSRVNSKDTRQWVTCLGASSWAPVPSTPDYKFIRAARYLSYTASVNYGEDRAYSFQQLYHREPNVYEMIPYAAIDILSTLSADDIQSPDSLRQALHNLFKGNSQLLVPVFVETIH